MPGYHLPYFTAAAKNTYTRHGLEVEIVYPEPGPDNIRAVAQGRYDVCLTSVAHFLRALSEDEGIGARFVFMIARHTHMGVLFARGRPILQRGPIEGFSDLEGASFLGDPQSPFTREYLHLVDVLGYSNTPVVDVPYGEVKEALAAGKGDVTADFVDLLPDYRAAAAGRNLDITALAFHEAGIDIYGSGLVAGTGLIGSRPEIVGATIAAIEEALEESRRDPTEGVEALVERFPEAGADRTLAGWRAGEALIFVEDGRPLGSMDPDKWTRTIDYHAAVHGTARTTADSVFVDLR
ncbi:MAG: ABC transporter substrate-binding protein [Actinomycetota bacterium]